MFTTSNGFAQGVLKHHVKPSASSSSSMESLFFYKNLPILAHYTIICTYACMYIHVPIHGNLLKVGSLCVGCRKDGQKWNSIENREMLVVVGKKIKRRGLHYLTFFLPYSNIWHRNYHYQHLHCHYYKRSATLKKVSSMWVAFY